MRPRRQLVRGRWSVAVGVRISCRICLLSAGFTGSSPRFAQPAGRLEIDRERLWIVVRVSADRDAIVALGARDADVAVADVADDGIDITLERIAPPAAAVRHPPQQRAGRLAPDCAPSEERELTVVDKPAVLVHHA